MLITDGSQESGDMKPTSFHINSLTEADNDDKIIKFLLTSFRIEHVEPEKNHILVARNRNQTKILGILIAESTQKQTLKITYIYVKPMWRRLSIGNALMQRLEQDCLAKGFTVITATFDRESQAMKALTKRKKGWSGGERLNAFTFTRRSAMEPILKKLETTMDHRIPQTEIIPLCECNRQDIIHASELNHVPLWAQLNASNLSKAIDDLSRVFIHNNQIIGWLITFPLLDETLDYRILWMNENYRKTGIAIRALTAIIRQAHFQDNLEIAMSSNDFGHPWLKGFFVMRSENQAMVNFANKRLVPGITKRSTLIYRRKFITYPVQQRDNWKQPY